jgi:hypothetical protein
MAKKRDNVKSPEKDSKNSETSSGAKTGKGPKSWQVVVFIVMVIIIALLVLFILLSKSSGLKTPCEIAKMGCYKGSCPSGYEQTSPSCKKDSVCCKQVPQKSACETYGNSCHNNSCPSNTLKIDMACNSNTEFCCRNLSNYQSPCEEQKNICFKSILPEPTCPDGYTQINLGCILGEICCKKVITPCETRGYSCKDSCSAIEKQINFNCSAGKTCCQYQIATRSDCEHFGYQCQYSSCNTGFEEAGICDKDYICCKRETNPNRLFIYGFVKIQQGNCIPPVNYKLCTTSPIDTEVAIFPPISQLDMNGLYYRPTIDPIQSQRTIKNSIIGYYEIALPPGTYSIFAKDPLGGSDYYCNQFSSDGKACTFTITNASLQKEVIIDHSTH